jgi:hypothetical protein
MNRFLRSCLVNHKNLLKIVVNKSNPVTTTVFRKINYPISTAASTLFSINRSFNNVRRGKNYQEDLLEEADSNEVSVSPKAHKEDATKKKYDEGQPKFEDFNLSKELLQRLNDLGYESPFPIQSATLPFSLKGK